MRRDSQAVITRKLERALHKLLRKDRYLIKKDVNERSITHKLAEYLQSELPKWHVDCEYNKDDHKPKSLSLRCQSGRLKADDVHARTVYPDVIVHRRGTSQNRLVIEVKKSSNPDGPECDVEKLEAFRKQLSYQYAVFILLNGPDELEPYELRWF